LAGGSAGTIPYQSAAGTTVQLAAGTSGYVLQANGAAAPSWVVASTAAGVNNGTLTMNVSGTGLSGSQTFTANQSSAATFTVTSNATNLNTASTIVARDASGNFTAGTITAALSGNASTATSATTAGTITSQANSATITAATANTASTIVLRDASGNFSAGTITATLSGNASTATTAANVNNGTLTMNVSGTGLSGSQTFTANQSSAATFTVTSNATSANTASTIVARDASGNFTAGTITAALTGNVTGNVTGSSGSCTGNSATATSATTATTATTANATNTSNNFQMNSLGVGTAGSGTAGEIRATNNVTAYYSSDIKFKENVRNIPNAAITAAAIGGKLFDWKTEYIEEHGGEDGYFIVKSDFGVIAQDVLAKFPVAVRTRPDGSLAVDYEKLSALALAANAEHEARISKLEALVAQLIKG
jgi:hypothetical protein